MKVEWFQNRSVWWKAAREAVLSLILALCVSACDQKSPDASEAQKNASETQSVQEAADSRNDNSAETTASAQSKGKRIPLRVMYLPEPKNNDPNTKTEIAVHKAFHEKYPDIELSAFSGITIQGI